MVASASNTGLGIYPLSSDVVPLSYVLKTQILIKWCMITDAQRSVNTVNQTKYEGLEPRRDRNRDD